MFEMILLTISLFLDLEEESEEQPVKLSFQVYLTNLLNCVNRDMIDKAAIEFAENYNSKNNRKKLIS